MKIILALVMVTSFQVFAGEEEGEPESPSPQVSQAGLASAGCDPAKHAAGADTVVANTTVQPGQATPSRPGGRNAEDPSGRTRPGKPFEGSQLRRAADVVAVVAVTNDPFGQPCPRPIR